MIRFFLEHTSSTRGLLKCWANKPYFSESTLAIVATNKICQWFYRNRWYQTCTKGEELHKTCPAILHLTITQNILDNLIRSITCFLVLVPIPTIIGMVSFSCTRIVLNQSLTIEIMQWLVSTKISISEGKNPHISGCCHLWFLIYTNN